MKTEIKKILSLSVMPDQTILPEWEETKKKLSVKTEDLQTETYNLYNETPENWFFYLGFFEITPEISSSIHYFIRFSKSFIYELSRVPELEILRNEVVVDITEDQLDAFEQSVPMITGSEYIDRDMLKSLWIDLGKSFSRLIKNHSGSVKNFFQSKNQLLHLVGRVFFHLVENKNSDQPFAFMATYSSGISEDGSTNHLPMKHAIEEYDNDDLLNLLSTVYLASEKSSLVNDLIETGELFHPIAWSADEAYIFLKEIPLYEDCGVICRIPDWWKKKSGRVSVSVSFGEKKPSIVGMNALVDFNANILFGDALVSKEEAEKMLSEYEGLVFIKNRWVEVDHDKLKLALEACDQIKNLSEDGITLREAMRMQLNPENILKTTKDVDFSVSNGQWLQSVVYKLKKTDTNKSINPGKGFKAELRDYQEKGLNWLSFLNSLKFGACLADDMGLGKTVQILAFLSTLTKKKNLPASLLIVPASLISNWLGEILKFAPALKVFVAHPGFSKSVNGKKDISKNENELNEYDLVITSYTLIKNNEWIDLYNWNYLILDEAQAIKNPGTKQTRAVKKIKSINRIIMTGTPVENKISDLWSLFDFLNPGLLGNKAEFSSFAKKLKNHPEGYVRLRKLISPYILRRLKTDKSVIDDLPDKVEMKSYADLSKKQIVLYKKHVKDLEKLISDSTGIQRKGIILSSLMKFKQLCNHPDQLTGNGNYKESESGKFQRLRQICETIYEKRERVLIFTQFKEIIEPVRAFLETIFHHKGLVLHGSISVGKRKKIIETFQDERYCPFIVLSIKAGGVGLNLTKANHVVHFDRWWNPAVENQATDRAFRIGQHKKVIVHKFITRGTVEEKIDMMLDEKKELADQLISKSGDSMITEMETEKLMDLFKIKL
ncbi:MAG: DEAD/DEAH box helicase [Deltaproteobacteria bacterium]|nr:DEAD/DEAH box helicase [Deltaproteobacteria bacterium]